MGRREWLMLFALALLWGGSFFFVKVLVAELPPLTVALGRVGLAALLLDLWLFWRGQWVPASPKLWGAFILMGLLNNAVPFLLIAFGETRISSGLAAVLNATTPIFAVLVAHAATASEKLDAGKAAGVLFGFAGVAALLGEGVLAGLSSADTIGEIACLSAALSYAFAGVYGRRFKDIAPIKVAAGQLTASTLLLIPPAAFLDHPWAQPWPSVTAWAALFGIALPCTALAYILYFRILAATGATNLLLVTFLIPITALLLGWLFLGELLLARHLLGMGLIGGGLALIDGRLPRLLWSSRRRIIFRA